MTLIRQAIAPIRAARRQPVLASSVSAARSFAATARQRGGHGGESQFEPPSGWLWGVKPGEKAEPEGWEWPTYIFIGSLVATGVALAFKPDTT